MHPVLAHENEGAKGARVGPWDLENPGPVLQVPTEPGRNFSPLVRCHLKISILMELIFKCWDLI